ncbi:hypothetical protein [Synechococcus sp. BA-132 BA5]|uniref:hypothetical protein n=1 Tax=Synechococcus sp. BA-132 BA5 TaxID=3110252 RepID=UPI002B1F2544|nr:hypothetical protein [Synechococcus sp. BA-132 BA5]MEA5414839.1 hypothetical protein [Synechococcus sp. BA-132 BA5]
MPRQGKTPHSQGTGDGASRAERPCGNSRAKWTGSSSRQPCPVCGRNTDDKCRRQPELLSCWHGSRFHPPAGLHLGGVLRVDGADWFVVALAGGYGNNSMVLAPHRPLSRSQRQRRVITAPPRPAPPADPAWAEEPTDYRPSNWIIAALYQRHCLAMGWEVVL